MYVNSQLYAFAAYAARETLFLPCPSRFCPVFSPSRLPSRAKYPDTVSQKTSPFFGMTRSKINRFQ